MSTSGPLTMPDALRLQLTKHLGPVQGSDLAAHLERDGLFIVSADLDLVECGVAIAMDDVAQVGMWIEQGKLRKPTPDERSAWPDDKERRWTSLVVQPFVLVQDAIALPSRDAP